MLISEIPALQQYWYPVAYSSDVSDTPMTTMLFGEQFVVWRDAPDGQIRAAIDYCPHRGARLSQGSIQDGCMVCPYHGWKFDGSGACVRIPQNAAGSAIPSRARLGTIHADERYELIWICVADEPRAPIPDLVELDDPAFTLVHELMEEWDVTAVRCVDNALDVSHLSFVHGASIGDSSRPEMSDFDVERNGDRIRFTISYTAKVTEEVRRNTGLAIGSTTRTTHAELVQPLVFRGVLAYENGLKHVLYKTAAPIDDHRTLFCQFIARNDDPDEAKQIGIIEGDRVIQSEDRALLEGITSEFAVDITTEVHTKTDRMTVEYRKIIAELAAESGAVRPDSTWDPLARRAAFPI